LKSPFINRKESNMNPIRRLAVGAGLFVATLTLALAPMQAVHAAGLPNCAQSGAAPCFETVWAAGVPSKMTFANLNFPLTTRAPTDNFYVVAPQTGTPQGTVPFLHYHVVGDHPQQNLGDYSVHYRGFLVFCGAQGISTGACVPEDGSMPLAKTVNGQMLTSVGAIESAADSRILILVDTHAVLVATINAGK
jgi:hypothetical protein